MLLGLHRSHIFLRSTQCGDFQPVTEDHKSALVRSVHAASMTSMLITRSPCGWSNGLRTRPNFAAPLRCSLPRVHSMSLSKITAQILQDQRTQAQEQQTHEGVEQLEVSAWQASQPHICVSHAIAAARVQYTGSYTSIGACLVQSDVTAAIRQRPRDFTLVETPKQLRSMLQELAHADTLAVDCEGVNLGQPQGQLCLIQLAARQSSNAAASTSTGASTSSGTGSNGSGTSAAGSRLKAPAPLHARLPAPSQQLAATSSASPAQSPSSAGSKKAGRPALLQIYIVDVHQLQWRAFHYKLDPSDPSSISLKSLLENSQLTKLMYDIRSDAANLVRQFDVRLRGAYDLQVGTRELLVEGVKSRLCASNARLSSKSRTHGRRGCCFASRLSIRCSCPMHFKNPSQPCPAA